MNDTPTVLFLCVHNAGRSQMALGWFQHLAGDSAIALVGWQRTRRRAQPSRGRRDGRSRHRHHRQHPARWTDADVDAADVVVTMGCGDTCPFVPGKRYEDWPLDDPAGQPIERVRPIRDEIRQRVLATTRHTDPLRVGGDRSQPSRSEADHVDRATPQRDRSLDSESKRRARD